MERVAFARLRLLRGRLAAAALLILLLAFASGRRSAATTSGISRKIRQTHRILSVPDLKPRSRPILSKACLSFASSPLAYSSTQSRFSVAAFRSKNDPLRRSQADGAEGLLVHFIGILDRGHSRGQAANPALVDDLHHVGVERDGR